jgi:large subunit ribosomal protein L25
MKEIAIELQNRVVTGKAVKRLRNEGLVPAVIHDHGKESILVAGPYMELIKLYHEVGKHRTVSVKAGGKQYMTLIKTAEFDPRRNQLRHLVFDAINANETVTTEVPVEMKLDEGNESTPAERAGLIVLRQTEVVEIEALPKDLPEALYFNGEKLVADGDQVTVADLIVPQGVTILDEPTQSLATVLEPSALQAANDAAGGDAEEEVAPAADAATPEAEAPVEGETPAPAKAE